MIAARAALTAPLLVSAGVHAWVVPEHLREWPAAGAFFVVLTIAQVVMAAALWWRPVRPVLLGTLALTVGTLGLYVWSRTTGLPLAPPHEHVHVHDHSYQAVGGIGRGSPVPVELPEDAAEPVGTPDLVALVAELLSVAVLTAALGTRDRRRVIDVLATAGAGLALWRVVA